MLASKTRFRMFYLLLIFVFVLAIAGPAQAAPIETNPTKTSSIQQYNVGGHIIGFAPRKVYLAGLDHALTLEFVNGADSVPVGVTATAANKMEGAPALGRVIYQNVWPHINVTYTAAKTGLTESTYTLHPGAQPADIRLKYNTPVQLLEDGSLTFAFETGNMTESAPVAFQDVNGKRLPVAARFTLHDSEVGFTLGAYNPNLPLTIDPTYEWHTFYGSSSTDYGTAITKDTSGNIYIAGVSSNAWNGPDSTAPLHFTNSVANLVVVKLTSAGVYQWHTFYGPINSVDRIICDVNGNIYVTGSSEYWAGVDDIGPLHTHSAMSIPNAFDIFVLKLNSLGEYQWHTFYGPVDPDARISITSDMTGNLYASGRSPTIWNGPVSTPPLHSPGQMFVLKLDGAGKYQWHTFYGRLFAVCSPGPSGYSRWDYSGGITSDESGNIYIVGTRIDSLCSSSTWDVPGNIAPRNAYAGGVNKPADIVIMKLNSAGEYQWHTFYGSSNDDYGHDIAVDKNGYIYVSGTSYGKWDGPGASLPLNPYAGTYNNGFPPNSVLIKLNSQGDYQWHTFYPLLDTTPTGGIYKYFNSIKVGAIGDIYMVGTNNASWNGPGAIAPLKAYTGGKDIAVVKLNNMGSYLWHTFYGSQGDDYGQDITEENGDLYIAGSSDATWNGPEFTAPLNTVATGGKNIVVFKLDTSTDITPPSVTINQVDSQLDPTTAAPVNFTVTFSKPINVSTFTAADLTFGGTAAGMLSAVITQVAPHDGTKFNVAVSGMTGSGTVTAVLAADAVTDLAGNLNTASTSSDNSVSYTYDVTSPNVIINQASGQSDPTGNSPINFTATFNEPISLASLNETDFTLGGAAGASNLVITQVAPADGTKFNVAVSGMSSSGTVTVSMAAGAVTDLAGNPNNASTSTDNTVTYNYDTTPPTAIVEQAATQSDPTSNTPVNFTVTFSKAINVSTFIGSDFVLGGTAGPTTAIISQITPNNGTKFNVAVTGMSGVGTVTAALPAGQVADFAGNSNIASISSDNSVTYDELDILCPNVPAITPGEHLDVLRATDDVDPYKFTVTDPYTTIVATLTPPASGDFDLYLYDSCQDGPIDTAWGHIGRRYIHIGRRYIHIGAGGDSETEVRFNIGKQIGTYYLAVMVPSDGVYAPGQYKLNLTLDKPDFGLIDTLILYNPTRFKTTYGLEAASQMMDKLTQLAQHPRVNGLILQLDQFPDLMAAYQNWENTTVINGNENSYSANVTKANLVSDQIRIAIRQFMQTNKKLITGYVVVVGDDNQIPFRRLSIGPDAIPDTHWMNERDYLSAVLGDVPNTSTDAALMANQTLSDDFYGDYIDRPGTGDLPILAVGRLLDTPARIQKAIDTFLDFNGVIDLTDPKVSATVAGYSFMADAARQLCDRLNTNGGLTTDCTLIDSPAAPNPFTGDDLYQKFIVGAPNFVAYHGNTDQVNLLTPSGNPLTAQQISDTSYDPFGALWWVVGCQSGLVLPNSEHDPLSLAQALADHGVTYIGNTGWAWGSRGPATLSELLYQQVADHLTESGSMAIGEALRQAKRDYFIQSNRNTHGSGSNSLRSYYDTKVRFEATLYGLPMFEFDFPDAVSSNVSSTIAPKAAVKSTLSIPALPTQFHPSGFGFGNLTHAAKNYDGNIYYTNENGEYAAFAGLPLLPQSEYLKFVTSLGKAKGVIWKGGSYTIERGNNPLVLNPTQLRATPGVEPSFNGTFPIIPAAITAIEEADGTFTNPLTFQTGQYTGNETAGTFTLFDDMDFLVGLWSGDSSDETPPTLSPQTATLNGNLLHIQLPVTDASGIYKVFVTYTNLDNQATSGVWQSLELTNNAGACATGQQTYSVDVPSVKEISYFIQVMDCTGNVAVQTDNGQYYRVYPTVKSLTRASLDPTSANNVNFTVTFSEPVTGVDAGDFALTATGVTGAAITSVSGSGATRTVSIKTGFGNGTIRLNVVDNDTILDVIANPLGGIGVSNGNFTTGQIYIVNKMLTLNSLAAQDGWILESKENSSIGGTMNSIATTFNIGDDVGNKQYLGLLHFDTSSLPDKAVVTSITLKIMKQGLVGTNPFSTHGGLLVDIRKPFFGTTAALAIADFQSLASKPAVATFSATPVGNWFDTTFGSAAYPFINLTGTTQLRLRFTKDDNNDLGADYLSFFSGNAAAANRPTLIVQYYVP